MLIERILAGHHIRLRGATGHACGIGQRLRLEMLPEACELERVLADEKRLGCFQRGQRPIAAVGLADARQAIGGNHFYDSA